MEHFFEHSVLLQWLNGLSDRQWWFLKAAIILMLTLFVSLLISACARRLHERFSDKRQSLRTVVLHSLHKPLQLFIWMMAFSLVGEVIRSASRFDRLDTFLIPLRQVGTMAALTWFVWRFIGFAEKRLINLRVKGKTPIDPTTASAITKLSRLFLLFIASLFILPSFGFTVSGVLAFGSVGAFAVSFAAKDLLANFFGSLMLYIDRPFKVGDWIASPDKNIEGTVEEINWRLTRIRTFDKRPLYVPNSLFLSISVVNPSRMLNRRINAIIGVRYDDWQQVDVICLAIKAMLKAHPEIDQNQTTYVNLVNFGASSLDINVYTFTKTTQWVPFQEIQHDVFLKILAIIDSHGAECAFPTQTLHVPNAVKMASSV